VPLLLHCWLLLLLLCALRIAGGRRARFDGQCAWRGLWVVSGNRAALLRSRPAWRCEFTAQPGRAARRCVFTCAYNSADSRGSGVGLAPRPQALPMPAAALVLYISRSRRSQAHQLWIHPALLPPQMDGPETAKTPRESVPHI
jgi:hypothetical protein